MIFLSLKILISLSVPDVFIPPAAYKAFNVLANPLTRCEPGELISPNTVTLTGLICVREISKNVCWG